MLHFGGYERKVRPGDTIPIVVQLTTGNEPEMKIVAPLPAGAVASCHEPQATTHTYSHAS